MTVSENKKAYDALWNSSELARISRDSLECGSPEWRAAHQVYKAACEREDAFRKQLAKTDRNGDWKRPSDEQLMLLGYY